ncbi:MAG: aryl-alcohol dehydrogenase [Candidatus Electrothrix sp. AW1]|nr:aryl-alcohol dehydrogenase [Candidatus Electrothrix sp. AX1]MCI5182291.1 aryl-alcohol dehydrogenase [Candidatus Electrothrix gigas]
MFENDKIFKLGLGTVQFGMNYGISNFEGQASKQEVCRILKIAQREGVRYLDTASQYGTSEQVLGETMPVDHQFQIITKTPHFKSEKIEQQHISLLNNSFEQSLDRLSVDSVYGLMIHNAEDLFAPGGENLYQALNDLKKAGKVRKAGVSVYTVKQIDLINSHYDIDIIQVPVNILDQRLIQSGHLSDLKKRGVEIHARSIFLQGLLLMDPEKLPENFTAIHPLLSKFHSDCAKIRVTPLAACLDFVMGLEDVDCVIVGACSTNELNETIENILKPNGLTDYSVFALLDEKILNPALWKA